jgi:hypothetical protein
MRRVRVLTTITGILAVGLLINLYQPRYRAADQVLSPEIKQGASPAGLVLLNERTGLVFACAPTTSLTASGMNPSGTCLRIGSIPTTSLSGNGFVSMSYNGTFYSNSVAIPYGVAFVGNLANAYIDQCTYQSVPTTGIVSGKCTQVTTPDQ